LLQQSCIRFPQSWNDLSGIPRVSGGELSK
jgi:hypothetical protein